jgi:hypothetical protein
MGIWTKRGGGFWLTLRECAWAAEIIRIISARAAEKHEVRRYRKQTMDRTRAAISTRNRRAPGRGDDSKINFEDVPRLTAEQLANMVRIGPGPFARTP